MKVTLNNLTNSVQSLQELTSLKFKASVAFQLVKLVKSIETELKSYEEVRVSTIKKYSTDGETVDEDKIQEFIKEITELSGKEVEIYDYSLLQSDLSDKEVSAKQLIQLEWLIAKAETPTVAEA